MKRITLAISIGLMLVLCNLAYAGTGEELLAKGEYEFYRVPSIRVVLVTDELAWHKIVRYNFPTKPDYTGRSVKGIAVRDKVGDTLRYTILMPLTASSFKSFIEMETVFGHEFLHIIDYSVGKELFDPDTWDYAERMAK